MLPVPPLREENQIGIRIPRRQWYTVQSIMNHRAPHILSLFLLLLLLSAVGAPARLEAQEPPPRVGLVLSGGGARGAAHIGVLRALEQAGVPIECIAATSMGALVGGLYAAGHSPDEIERFLESQDWNSLFTDAPQRRLTPLIERSDTRYQGQVSFRGWNPELPSGMWGGQPLTESLDILTTRQMLEAGHDFDRLRVRFRAVATNLLDGKPYVFRQGSMTQALRASMAVPLLFTPLEHEGMLLADGGLTNNLPTDIAQAMGADIIIAVDVTSPLLDAQDLRTFLNVIDQSISLQMEDNVRANQRLASLLLKPDLEGYSSNDYVKIPEIIRRGEEAARARMEELKELTREALPRARVQAPPSAPPVIDSISFEGLVRIPASQLQAGMRILAGHRADPTAIGAEVSRLYATRFFESVSYNLTPLDEGRYHLTFVVREALLNTLGASLRYDNDYQFVALVEYTARQLFHTSSKLTVSTQFGGLENHFASLRIVPPSLPFLFVEPRVEVSRLERMDIRQEERFDKFTDKREGGQLMIGALLHRQLELSGGYRFERVRITGGSEPYRLEGASRHAGLRFRLRWDSLDNAEFPRSGARMELGTDLEERKLGGDHDYSRWQAEYRHYLTPWPGTTFQFMAAGAYVDGEVPFYNLFFVGGHSFTDLASRQLLGLRRDEFRMRQMAIARVGYRREVFARPLNLVKRGYLTAAYNGAFLGERTSPPYDFRYFNGVGVGLAADTMVGPLHLQVGWGEGGRLNFHISFGPGF